MTQIRREIENTDSDYDREKLQERLAKLAGGVAVIKAGAATEVELKERKHRIEDAVRNAKAAVEEGIVAGGGVALIQAGKKAFESDALTGLVGDEATGANIVRVAIEAPLKQIALNAGLEPGVVANKVAELPSGQGLNAATGEYVDMLAAGIIDPAKVTRSALQNAASIAGLFLTTEVVVADKPEKARGSGRRPDRWHGLLRSVAPDTKRPSSGRGAFVVAWRTAARAGSAEQARASAARASAYCRPGGGQCDADRCRANPRLPLRRAPLLDDALERDRRRAGPGGLQLRELGEQRLRLGLHAVDRAADGGRGGQDGVAVDGEDGHG